MASMESLLKRAVAQGTAGQKTSRWDVLWESSAAEANCMFCSILSAHKSKSKTRIEIM